ncbi:hypothetical protein [Streptomyces erythrochromogenes]
MTVTAAAAVLAVAGCSSDKGADDRPAPKDPTAAAVEAARVYQEARNDDDWAKACAMQTDRYRDGTVEACVAEHQKPSPTPTPSPSQSSPPPLEYADGTTVRIKPKASASGPERADMGPVTAGSAVPVPAIGDHPPGTGVQVEYAVTWPTSSSTSRDALRLVQQGDQWLVDQAEDILESDIAHGNPVHDALMRR